jgi:hypothetical protein
MAQGVCNTYDSGMTHQLTAEGMSTAFLLYPVLQNHLIKLPPLKVSTLSVIKKKWLNMMTGILLLQ